MTLCIHQFLTKHIHISMSHAWTTVVVYVSYCIKLVSMCLDLHFITIHLYYQHDKFRLLQALWHLNRASTIALNYSFCFNNFIVVYNIYIYVDMYV